LAARDNTSTTFSPSNGASIYKATVEDTLKGTNLTDPKLNPNDVVSILPLEQMRIWISGAVKNPGEVRIRSGSDLSRAIASVGGMQFGQEDSPDEAQVVVRRGPKITQYPAKDIAMLRSISIEPGDDISVVLLTGTRITVTGEVAKPGEFVLKGDIKIQKALAMAGGPTTQGTLSMVRVLRQGEMFTLDASKAETSFNLQANDLVVVERNERSLYVLGEVTTAGRYLMEDNRTYRVTDALAAAGGLGQRGTFRRVYLARAGADGKTVLRQFNLDEFLKDGKLESNPLLQPGDCILFGQPNGLSFSAASQVLSSFVLLNTLVRK
jgi:protein involved in polysaccharide export with SLBB domain